MLAALALAFTALSAVAGKPTTENKDWEQACEGSNIAVTSVDGKWVTIEAFAQHFAEGRQWQCHFKDGEIVSAVYRHFTVTRKIAGDAGEITTELDEDRVEVFHFPDHQITEMDLEFRKDLMEILAIASHG